MSVFPRLSTGAVAQYPTVRELRFSTEIHRYLDNSEQRHRDRPAFRRTWRIELSRLDETEAVRLVEFFTEQQGRFGGFDFEDPWSGAVIPNCRFEQDQLAALTDGEWDSGMQLTIIEPVTA